ncbi:hypothetical protein [Bradyrhizobium sp.]|uniref:hypothetical protein n=1 Tax=Bradyrhizobium sp. TaxID=376 RepID=UPI002612BA9A|nr:hypothetical protein [Bradyrhizobium sp.]
MGNVYFRLFLTQLPLYAFVVGFICAAYFAFRGRRYIVALCLVAIAGFPAASYLYSYANGRYLAPAERKVEVASWRRESITRDSKPRVFISTWGTDGVVPKTLVVLGRFEKAYGLVGDDWYYFEQTPGSVCVDTHYDKRMLDRMRGAVPCVSATKTGRRKAFRQLNMPEIAEPHLLLLADADAPLHHESDTREIFASSTLELRHVSDSGNKLVSFWEAPYFDVPVFPPILILGKGWFRTSFAADHAPRPDVVKFVLDALGDT